MFSIKELLRESWGKFKANIEVSILATLLVVILGSIGGKDDKFHSGIFLLGLVFAVASIIVRIGYTKIFLRINDGENPKFVDIFKEYKTFWRYIGTIILNCLAVFGGFILLIIPGVFWAIRFAFSPFIVVDTKLGPIASMKESYAITKGHFWKLLGFWVVMGLLNIAGLIVFGIGLLITIPLSTLAAISVYRKLTQAKAGIIQTPSTEPIVSPVN
jgi:uncharacterized membrane protein